MNRFEQTLTQAKNRHRRRIITGVVFAILVAALIASGFFILNFTGRVKVEILPSEVSDIAVIEIIEGYAFEYQRNLLGINSAMKFRVLADGFETETLDIFDATWKRGKIDVILREIKSTLQAVTEPKIADVQWYLNDALMSRGDQFDIALNSGEYTLRATHPYFTPIEKNLMIERNQDRNLILPLDPIEGLIEITSDPAGASVSIDSIPQGRTPLKIQADGGLKQLTLSLYGHNPKNDELKITNKSPEASKHYKLVAATIPHQLTLSPDSGILIVNGKAVTAKNNTNLELTFGTDHIIQYSKSGYVDKKLQLQVNSTNPETIDIELTPILGIVEISSDPRAQIAVNGNSSGTTPKTLRLLTIPQTITASQPGFRSQTRTVTPKSDAITEIEFELLTEKEHRMKNSPLQYANSVGIELKLFKKPDTVILGSQRGEIGRQAHEFLREVSLERPFYIGVYEVTEDQFQKFKNPGLPSSGSKKPVVGVDWLTAAMFCNYLSKAESLNEVYEIKDNQLLNVDPQADGYRLPTEAEWEWLARKAERTKQTLFSWGDDKVIPANAGNLADNSAKGILSNTIPLYNDGYPQIADIGSFQPNAAGIHDLTGNVSEWVHDIYTLKPPRSAFKTDSPDTSTNLRRTIKGSNWKSATITEIRAAWRAGSKSASNDVGFRVARYLY